MQVIGSSVSDMQAAVGCSDRNDIAICLNRKYALLKQAIGSSASDMQAAVGRADRKNIAVRLNHEYSAQCR